MKVFALVTATLLRLSQCQVDETFFYSSRYGDINTVLKYLKQGVDVSARDTKGNTALIIAAGRGQVEIMKILLEHGANHDDCTAMGLFQGKVPFCTQSLHIL